MPTAHRNLATGRLSEVHRGQCPPAPEGFECVRLARMPQVDGPWIYDEATQEAVTAPPTADELVTRRPVTDREWRALLLVVDGLIGAPLDGEQAIVKQAARRLRGEG